MWITCALFIPVLYRTFFFPNKLYEIDASGEIVHYSPLQWRSIAWLYVCWHWILGYFPGLISFFNLVYPSINQEMQEGLVNDYKESGWLPEWSSPDMQM